ncbi:MAG: quinate 5-dehydrogenase [Chloroflexota bacterium]
MKRAVSISIGSSTRNKAVEVELLGEKVSIERIGTDGDMEKAAQMYRELDGKVDAFGVGGADLGLQIDNRYYPLYSVQPMVRFVRQTPLVDGGGLKTTLERKMASFIDQQIGDYVRAQGRKVLVSAGVDRWGMVQSFFQSGWEVIAGDLMFGIGLAIPLRSERSLKVLAALLLPVFGRLPFAWIYPTGEKQEKRIPKFEKYYQWATVIAGDCLYIRRHMPDRLVGKVIATNTTTAADVEDFRKAGVKYLVTSTPVLDGRSFGTNMMEAALVAIAGKQRKLSPDELEVLLAQLNFQPTLQTLN